MAAVVSFLTGLLAGLALGWAGGRRYQTAMHGWSDYRGQRVKVAGMRRTAYRSTRRAAGVVAVALVVAVVTLYLIGVAE